MASDRRVQDPFAPADPEPAPAVEDAGEEKPKRPRPPAKKAKKDDEEVSGELSQ